MIDIPSALAGHDPRRIGVLFVDLQHRWAHKRSVTQIPATVAFSRQLAAMGVVQVWIGDDIGPHFEQPRAIQLTCPDRDFRHLGKRRDHHRFLVSLSDMTGLVIGKSEPDAFSNPLLAEQLRWEGVDTILACGYIASQCVMSTLLGARRAGFRIGMLDDLSVDNLSDGAMEPWKRWQYIERPGIATINSGEALEILHRSHQIRMAANVVEMRPANDKEVQEEEPKPTRPAPDTPQATGPAWAA